MADVDAQQDLQSLLAGTVAAHDASGLLASNASSPDPFLSLSLPAGGFSASLSGPCLGSGCLSQDSYYVLYLDADEDGDALVLPADNCPDAFNPANPMPMRTAPGTPATTVRVFLTRISSTPTATGWEMLAPAWAHLRRLPPTCSSTIRRRFCGRRFPAPPPPTTSTPGRSAAPGPSTRSADRPG